MAIQFLNNPKVGDNVKIEIGASSDLQIYHDGSNSYIDDSGTGDLYIRANNLRLSNADGSGQFINANNGGAVELYHNNNKRFETTAGGTSNTGTIDSTGTITVTGANGNVGINTDTGKLLLGASYDLQIYHDGSNSYIDNQTDNLFIVNKANDKDIRFQTDNGAGGTTTYFTIDGLNGINQFSKNVSLPDNVIAKFGNSSDLQIYHDGSNSYIKDSGTGTLNIQGSTQVLIGGANGEVGVQYVENAGVGLRHNNVAKLTTTSTGVSLTGNITATDNSYQVTLIDTSTSNRGEISVEDAAFGFYADRAAATADSSFFWSIDNANKMEINLLGGGEGQLRLNDYGPGNITGTVEFILGVDSNGNVIETSAGGSGTVTGTGAATRVAFWSGTTALSSDANLYWDNTNNRLGIGTTAPTSKLSLSGSQGALDLTRGTAGDAKFFMSSDSARLYFSHTNIQTTNLILKLDASDKSATFSGTVTGGNGSFTNLTIDAGEKLRFDGSGGHTFIQEVSNDTLIFATGGSERIRIDNSGNVGIGVTAPTMPLHVSRGGTSAATIGIGQTGTAVARLYMDASNGDFSGGDYMWIGQNNDLSGEIQMTQGAGAFNIKTQPSGTLTTRFTVLQNGNIGIGTTAPNGKLDIKTSNSGFEFFPEDSTDTNLLLNFDRTNSNYLNLQLRAATHQFIIGATERMRIDSSGQVSITNALGYSLKFANTSAANSGVNSGIVFNGLYNSGGAATDMASIRGGKNNVNDGDFGGKLTFHTRTNNGVDTERIRIDSAGKIGIGTSPTYNLDLLATNAVSMIRTPDTTSATLGLFVNSGSNGVGVIATDNGGDMTFDTGSTGAGQAERMRITSAGTVQVRNISVPTIQFYNTDTSLGTDQTLGDLDWYQSDPSGGGVGVVSKIRSVNSSSFQGEGGLAFHTGTSTGLAERMRINSAGRVGIGTNNPTSRLVLVGAAAADSTLAIANTTSSAFWQIQASSSANNLLLIGGGNVGIGSTAPTGKLEIQRSQVTTQFDRDSFLRLHPSATTNSGGLTNIFFGTSTTNNFGVAVGGRKGGTGDTSSNNNPEFSVRILNDAITGTEVLNINTAGNATFSGDIIVPNGKISTIGGNNLTISGTVASHAGLSFATNSVLPATVSATNNNVVDLGQNGNSFKNLYLGSEIISGGGATFAGAVTINYETPILILKDSNSTTPTNTLGYISIQEADATEVAFIGMGSGSNNQLYLHGSSGTTVNIASNGSTAMFIDTSQRVGVGTTLPGQKLVAAASDQSLFDVLGVYNGVTGTSALNKGAAIRIGQTTDGTYSNKIATIFEGNNPGYLQPALAFFTMNNSHLKGSEVERMRISSPGNVGIGTTAPTDRLTVEGGNIRIRSGNKLILNRANNGTRSEINTDTTGKIILNSINSEGIAVQNAGSTVLTVTSAGSVGIGTTAPDLGAVAGTRVLTIASPTADRWGILELAGNRGYGGNQVGELKFISTDSTNNGTLVSLTAINDASSTGTGGSLKFNTRPNGGTLTERMRITSAGNVGIGTTAPSVKFQVAGSSKLGGPVYVSSDGNFNTSATYTFRDAVFINNPNDTSATSSSNSVMSIGGMSGNSVKTSLITTGAIGIGTASPLAKLHLSDTTGGTIYIEDSDGTATHNVTSISNSGNNLTLDTRRSTGTFVSTDYQIAKNASGADYHRWFTQGSERMRIDSSGKLLVGKTSSNYATEGVEIRPDEVLITKDSGATLSLNRLTSDGSIIVLTKDSSTIGSIGSNTTGGQPLLDIAGATGNSNIRFLTTNTERIRITSTGRLGIGTTSPVAKFEVTDGSSSITLQEFSNGAAIFLDGVNGDFVGGDYYHILADGSSYLGLGGYGGGATPLNIDSSGKVGIGTNSPSSLLHLSSASSPTLRIVDTTNGVTLLAFSQDSNAHVGTFSNTDLIFDTNSNERMRILNGGNVGIGTSNPGHKLVVNGTFKYGSALEQAGAVSGSEPQNAPDFTPDAYLDIKVDGTDYLIPLFTKGS